MMMTTRTNTIGKEESLLLNIPAVVKHVRPLDVDMWRSREGFWEHELTDTLKKTQCGTGIGKIEITYQIVWGLS